MYWYIPSLRMAPVYPQSRPPADVDFSLDDVLGSVHRQARRGLVRLIGFPAKITDLMIGLFTLRMRVPWIWGARIVYPVSFVWIYKWGLGASLPHHFSTHAWTVFGAKMSVRVDVKPLSRDLIRNTQKVFLHFRHIFGTIAWRYFCNDVLITDNVIFTSQI